jgi:hypothetical protein
MDVTCGPGGVVHDYVPFYFCARSSMLLSVVNAKNVDQMFLIYLAIPVSVIDRDDVVFTSASANTEIPPPFFFDASNMTDLNWRAINSRDWSMPTDQERQERMAEVLIHRRVEIAMVDHIIVWNRQIKRKVEQMFVEADVQAPTIAFDGYNGQYHYYQLFYEGSRASIVTGPHFTKIEYQTAVKQILKGARNPSARFQNSNEMLGALRDDLGSLPETAELVGLESENEVHKENVGDHTLSVVNELTHSNEFAALDDGDKPIVELAAFLHDIGKGPKSRWASKGGKQQVDPDHPIKSVKMLVRILTDDVREIDPAEARVLAKLVCYHDLVGDILGKGRDLEQLEDIAESERELDMLIALGLADMRAVNINWYNNNLDRVPELRDQILNKLNSGSA